MKRKLGRSVIISLAVIILFAVSSWVATPIPVLDDPTSIDGKPLNIHGELNMTVLPVYFPDVNPSTSVDTLELVFADLGEYFYNQSYGRISLVGRVTQWVRASHNISFYACGNLRSLNVTERQQAREGCAIFRNDILNVCVNWSDCNFTEIVLIVYAGERSIHPHQAVTPVLVGTKTFDCEAAVAYELNISENRFSTMAHELAHCMGIRDIYNKDELRLSDCLDFWALMDDDDDWEPATDMCAYSRLYLGWIERSEIGDIVGNSTVFVGGLNIFQNYHPKVLRILIDEWRYYLVEARCNQEVPQGIIITQVDRSRKENGYGRVDMARGYRSLSDTWLGYHGAFQPGERYVDMFNGISIEVLNGNSTGYYVRVTRGEPVAPKWSSFDVGEDRVLEATSATSYNGTNYLALCCLGDATGRRSVHLYRLSNGLEHIYQSPESMDCFHVSVVARDDTALVVYETQMNGSHSILAQHGNMTWIVSGNDEGYNPTSALQEDRVFVAYENRTHAQQTIVIRQANSTLWNKSMTFVSCRFLPTVVAHERRTPGEPTLACDGRGSVFLACSMKDETSTVIEVQWNYVYEKSLLNYTTSTDAKFIMTHVNGWQFAMLISGMDGSAEIIYWDRNIGLTQVATYKNEAPEGLAFAGGLWTEKRSGNSIKIERVWNNYREMDATFVWAVETGTFLFFSQCYDRGAPSLLLANSKGNTVSFMQLTVTTLSRPRKTTTQVNLSWIAFGIVLALFLGLAHYFEFNRRITRVFGLAKTCES